MGCLAQACNACLQGSPIVLVDPMPQQIQCHCVTLMLCRRVWDCPAGCRLVLCELHAGLGFLHAACCRRIDEPLAHHIESEGLEFLQFTFRCFSKDDKHPSQSSVLT